MCNKANRTVKALKRLYPRMSGPRRRKRVLLATVVQSVTVYAALVWADVTKCRKYSVVMKKLQRKLATSITRAYRTIPLHTSLVLASILPLDLLAYE